MALPITKTLSFLLLALFLLSHHSEARESQFFSKFTDNINDNEETMTTPASTETYEPYSTTRTSPTTSESYTSPVGDDFGAEPELEPSNKFNDNNNEYEKYFKRNSADQDSTRYDSGNVNSYETNPYKNDRSFEGSKDVEEFREVDDKFFP